jgi:amino acid transporter
MTANQEAKATATTAAAAARHLSIFDAVCVVVGIVVATGVFKAPQLVAMNTAGPWAMLGAWALGGLLCLCGSLTYAELAAACPGLGGEYLYLSRSLGRTVGFMFVWARMTVIQTGMIAMLAYVFGDYVTRMMGWGPSGPVLCALSATAVLTALNAVGLRAGKWTQNVLTAAKVVGLLAITVLGLVFGKAAVSGGVPGGGGGAFGLAMVFVLLTFGGWNEAAYVAGELRGRPRSMLWVLVAASTLLTLLYMGANVAYLRILGFEGIRSSNAVAADAMAAVLGERGAMAVSILVAVAALGAIDGCIFTGARAVYAWGNDYPAFGVLGRWNRRLGAPVIALVAQGAVAVVLILLPALSETLTEALGSGFNVAVDYTAPVFWAFMLLTGLAVFVLRFKNPTADRPLGRWAPLATASVLCAMCAYMLYSSLAYTKAGALAGVAVLLAGLPVFAVARSCRGWGNRHSG